MPEAVIVDAIRTPIGRAFKGSLRAVRADELAATPLRALIERNPGVNFSETGDVMMGAASSIGEQAYNVGRNAALLAGIDHHVPARAISTSPRGSSRCPGPAWAPACPTTSSTRSSPAATARCTTSTSRWG